METIILKKTCRCNVCEREFMDRMNTTPTLYKLTLNKNMETILQKIKALFRTPQEYPNWYKTKGKFVYYDGFYLDGKPLTVKESYEIDCSRFDGRMNKVIY